MVRKQIESNINAWVSITFPSLFMAPQPHPDSALKKTKQEGKSGASSQNSLRKQTSSTAICIGTTFHLTTINQLQMGLLPGEWEKERNYRLKE